MGVVSSRLLDSARARLRRGCWSGRDGGNTRRRAAVESELTGEKGLAFLVCCGASAGIL